MSLDTKRLATILEGIDTRWTTRRVAEFIAAEYDRPDAPRIPDADWPSPGYLTPEPDPTGSEYRAGE